MAKIVSNFFISLDGVVEAPDQWHFPYFDEAMGDIVGAGIERSAGMLMGHRLYDEWAAYWPGRGEDDPVAPGFNAMAKWVLARHDFDATWHNTRVLAGDDDAVAAQVSDLKASVPDGDIMMSGSATTVRWLIARGLLDEIALLVHPIAVGRGQRLFEGPDTVALDLVHSETLSSGVLFLRYAPRG